MPLSEFPQEEQDEIAYLVAQPDPPHKWHYLGDPKDPKPMAAIRSRAWVEWHLARGVDPLRPRKNIRASLREAVIARDGYVCRLCGGDVERDDVHIDHVVPYARGGPTIASNLQVAHSRCNVAKGARV